MGKDQYSRPNCLANSKSLSLSSLRGQKLALFGYYLASEGIAWAKSSNFQFFGVDFLKLLKMSIVEGLSNCLILRSNFCGGSVLKGLCMRIGFLSFRYCYAKGSIVLSF